ncbi:MAG: DUF1254 domain-containing protein, partial [Anderseniella sp.]
FLTGTLGNRTAILKQAVESVSKVIFSKEHLMPKLPTFSAILLIAGLNSAAADISDIDSTGWAANPVDYGMTAKEFINAESRAFFADFLGRAEINSFHHFKTLATPDDRWVVSPNVDTLYSVGVVNVTEGFTLDIPDTGERFLSIQIIDENHMTPFHLYGGGARSFSADQFETDYIAIGLRIGTDGTPEDIAFINEAIQDKTKISGAKDEEAMLRPDLDLMLKVRAPMLEQFGKLPNSFGVMQERTADVKDWEIFTYVTAGAWGLSKNQHAMYATHTPAGAIGGECWIGTFPPVPAEEFFSITVYGPHQFLMTNENNVVSSTRGAITEADGSFTVVFGGEQCRGKAPNFAYTPEDGWNLMLRAYRPRVEEFLDYKMPTLTRIK